MTELLYETLYEINFINIKNKMKPKPAECYRIIFMRGRKTLVSTHLVDYSHKEMHIFPSSEENVYLG